jgi:gluconate 2-dehydrogenase gamma chain
MVNRISRRNFLQLATIGTGSLLLLPACSELKEVSHWHSFTNEEGTILEAVIEQIIPTDDWPGAKNAGVANFIDRQLMGPYIRYKDLYRKGLAALNKSCNELFDKNFQVLPSDKQTEILKNMESGKMAFLQKAGSLGQTVNPLWADELDKTFFNLVRDHTMQGFYGSPRHGGNKNYISYRMIGLDYPLIVGQNRFNK